MLGTEREGVLEELPVLLEQRGEQDLFGVEGGTVRLGQILYAVMIDEIDLVIVNELV